MMMTTEQVKEIRELIERAYRRSGRIGWEYPDGVLINDLAGLAEHLLDDRAEAWDQGSQAMSEVWDLSIEDPDGPPADRLVNPYRVTACRSVGTRIETRTHALTEGQDRALVLHRPKRAQPGGSQTESNRG